MAITRGEVDACAINGPQRLRFKSVQISVGFGVVVRVAKACRKG